MVVNPVVVAITGVVILDAVMVDPVNVEYAIAVVNRLLIRSVSDISKETG
jgi:hypothetical protein